MNIGGIRYCLDYQTVTEFKCTQKGAKLLNTAPF